MRYYFGVYHWRRRLRRLSIATDTQDVITSCRVLHDLPAAEQPKALAKLHRVCPLADTLEILELPLIRRAPTPIGSRTGAGSSARPASRPNRIRRSIGIDDRVRTT